MGIGIKCGETSGTDHVFPLFRYYRCALNWGKRGLSPIPLLFPLFPIPLFPGGAKAPNRDPG